MLRKIAYATMILILTIGAASAQADLKDIQGGENPMRDVQEKKTDRAIDRDYQSTMNKNSDPGSDVRQLRPRRPKPAVTRVPEFFPPSS
jgi:hypothetical protein